MIQIYKYLLEIDDTFRIYLPIGAKVLHVGPQGRESYLWASVDLDASVEAVSIHVRGTGHHLPDGYPATIAHLGTFQQGSYVWHVFGPTSLVP